MPIIYLVVKENTSLNEGIPFTSLTEATNLVDSSKENCDIYYCDCQLITPVLKTIYKL